MPSHRHLPHARELARRVLLETGDDGVDDQDDLRSTVSESAVCGWWTGVGGGLRYTLAARAQRKNAHLLVVVLHVGAVCEVGDRGQRGSVRATPRVSDLPVAGAQSSRRDPRTPPDVIVRVGRHLRRGVATLGAGVHASERRDGTLDLERACAVRRSYSHSENSRASLRRERPARDDNGGCENTPAGASAPPQRQASTAGSSATAREDCVAARRARTCTLTFRPARGSLAWGQLAAAACDASSSTAAARVRVIILDVALSRVTS